MQRLIFAGLFGVIFGTGIAVSGMINPSKVLNFFDIAGTWDPSLLLVMVSALTVAAIGFRFVLRREKPALDQEFHLPTKSELDVPLIAGSAIFGIGWGIAGFCPGGAIPAIGLGETSAFAFVGAMVAGILIARTLRKAFNLRAAETF